MSSTENDGVGWTDRQTGTQVSTDHLGICGQLNGYEDQAETGSSKYGEQKWKQK